MAKAIDRKPSVRKKNIKKKNSFFSVKFYAVVLSILIFIFGIYHYRNAILYYFSFKSDKVLKEEKMAQARIFQILKAHSKLTFGFDVSQFQGKIDWNEIDSIENKFQPN